MSPKRWILLLIFYISYLMFGASIYYHIEHGQETELRAIELQSRIEINEYLLDKLATENVSIQNEILKRISDYCGKPVTDYRTDSYNVPYTWTFYHSFFFAFTVCSTVGYGNISPTTTLGRMIMIAYSVIGIPINSILFGGLAEYFARIFRSIYHHYKKYKMSNDIHYVPPKLSLITTLIIALIPGITLFLLIPSWVFSYFENWPYSLAFYYSYVTTTTIGFGDYVPTFQPHQHREFGGWFLVYQIFIIIWFIFSLGYFLMIMTFITRGLQSKQLFELQQQLSSNIKATQHRIWHGVTKDISYLRRIFNELYLMKFKPIYAEVNSVRYLHRSISCPSFTSFNNFETKRIPSRKRTFSECFGIWKSYNEDTPIYYPAHVSSDTELNKFVHQKSFELSETFCQTTQLLMNVVNALAAVGPSTSEVDNTATWSSLHGNCDGFQGFTDSQILASEWPIPNTKVSLKQRNRSSSDFNLNNLWPKTVQTSKMCHNEWTWSGDNNHIQKAINIGHQFYLPKFEGITDETYNKKSSTKKNTFSEGFRRLFYYKKYTSQISAVKPAEDDIIKKNSDFRKYSVISVPEILERQAHKLNYYSTVTANASPTYFSNGQFFNRQEVTKNVLPLKLTFNGFGSNKHINGVYNEQSTIDRNSSEYLRSLAAANNCKQHLIHNINSINNRVSATSLPTRRPSYAIATRLIGNKFDSGKYNREYTAFDSYENAEEVLENTTLADIIRALEVAHTQAVFSNNVDPNLTLRPRIGDNIDSNIPPIANLFSNNRRTANINRTYTRRSTILSLGSQLNISLSPSNFNHTSANILSKCQQQTQTLSIIEPPPIYTQKSKALISSRNTSTTSSLKFKRRFSIRPTALQIPPGQAPLPQERFSATINANSIKLQQPQIFTSPIPESSITVTPQQPCVLRPSPLVQTSITNAMPSVLCQPQQK